MAFEELKDNTEKLHEDAKSFIDSSIAYYRLKIFKLAMRSISLIFKLLLVGLSFAIFFIFCSIAVAFSINDSLNSHYLGFLIVGGAYFLVTIFIYTFRRKLVGDPILRMFSKIFFND